MAFPQSRAFEGVAPSLPIDRVTATTPGFDLLLYSGGGETLGSTELIDADEDRGIGDPFDAHIWFSAATAMRPGRRARAAIRRALADLAAADPRQAPLTRWFDDLRCRIARAAGAPDAVVVLAPNVSGARALAGEFGSPAQLAGATDFSAADALANGRLAILEGSRFFGGPAHCAALLVPPDALASFNPLQRSGAVSTAPAALDLPGELRHLFDGQVFPPVNIGLGLRWSGALAEIERYLSIPLAAREHIFEYFQRRGRAMAARLSFIEVDPVDFNDRASTEEFTINLVPLDEMGAPLGFLGAHAVRAGLALPRPNVEDDAVCHVGALQRIDGRFALPVSLSAPAVNDIADRMVRGIAFDRAMAPLWRDLRTLLSKWAALTDNVHEISAI